MALAKEDIAEIESLIVKVLSAQPEAANDSVRYEIEIRERIVRVEEELKNQRELMMKGFNQVEKRFEQVEKRFEQVEKRFEQVDKRFEQQHVEIMGLHNEIKQLIRWSFGTLLALGGLIVAVLRIS